MGNICCRVKTTKLNEYVESKTKSNINYKTNCVYPIDSISKKVKFEISRISLC